MEEQGRDPGAHGRPHERGRESGSGEPEPPFAWTRGRLCSPERPRERLARSGVDSLSEAELVALILRTGHRDEDAMAVASRALKIYGGWAGLAAAPGPAIEQMPGLGPAKTASLQAAAELGLRLSESPLVRGERIRSPLDVERYFEPRLSLRRREAFYVLMLDVRNRLISVEPVSLGTLTASLVHPREVFRQAIFVAASAVLLVHNHPSGDPTPSAEDRAVTGRLIAAGDLMGIRVVDHVIVSPGGHFSFREAGELQDDPQGEISNPRFSDSP